MILGFKTGPKNFAEGQRVVVDLGATMCEVWFDVTKAEEYQDMFDWLVKHRVFLGLHHWGTIHGNIRIRGAHPDSPGIKTNIAAQDKHIRTETIAQIKKTIAIGADIGCVYVNAHPGAQATETIEFTDWKQTMLEDQRSDAATAKKLFLESAYELHEYAKSRGILLTIESIPARDSTIGHDRLSIYNPGNIPPSVLEEYVKSGGWFANDIAHTGSHFLLSEENSAATWQATMDFSRRLAPQTRLIHMNVITPPYNGTDSHDGITETDFAQETFPTKQGVIDFLRLFKDRNDVFVVNEPKANVAGNYKTLHQLAKEL